ncbi:MULTISPECIES: LLM class flavin-dependent oxidoreductase [unclassified Gordonia (in: high G+C Gram-positive bacteria)]|uniref:LLM class flavin-dependent oxidoreductase n=1 Tax=unclassified Gordonia (in: high G+C Gram-positive bacteria) TaxID=2657482 RepID=UPI0009AEB227|nr:MULTISPECIES: LLM class flavin-dependent oxidoreductase [unclassified Gordonia (in: high G+C Gram-positive bacteria)]MDF3280774.1 LLM class flavin-dependent oxidoreductase [Gordonia sp. N1V]OPX11883.1 monooxygenase [Gordonia sp. i37]
MSATTPADRFQLGLFSSNCSGGLAVTTIDDRWSGSWADNLALARLADEVGIDFMLPIARWIGYGGQTNFHEGVLEPIPWATAILASTTRLRAFATVHTAFNHPVVTAKQIATMDQVASGRAGINVVAGWNQPEYLAMGVDLPQDHDSRYALAQEWFDVVTDLWSRDGRWDHTGEFWNLTGLEGAPKPRGGRVPVLNAGSSAQGKDFAARNADLVFTIVGDPVQGADVVTSIRAASTALGRSTGVLTPTHVVCRPTRAEAEDYLHYYAVENADWEAVDNLMTLQGMHAQSFTKEMLATFRGRFAAGHGTCPLIGSPDDVAAQIAQFADAGFDGITMSFVDYISELEYFAAEVLPRLEKMGVRAAG